MKSEMEIEDSSAISVVFDLDSDHHLLMKISCLLMQVFLCSASLNNSVGSAAP